MHLYALAFVHDNALDTLLNVKFMSFLYHIYTYISQVLISDNAMLYTLKYVRMANEFVTHSWDFILTSKSSEL